MGSIWPQPLLLWYHVVKLPQPNYYYFVFFYSSLMHIPTAANLFPLLFFSENFVLYWLRSYWPHGTIWKTKLCSCFTYYFLISLEKFVERVINSQTAKNVGLCFLCPRSKNKMFRFSCYRCNENICEKHSKMACNLCDEWTNLPINFVWWKIKFPHLSKFNYFSQFFCC